MVQTIKFSQFASSGLPDIGDKEVGLKSGANTQFTQQWTWYPPGTTAERPTSPVQGILRFNTDSLLYEYYNNMTASWQVIENPVNAVLLNPSGDQTIIDYNLTIAAGTLTSGTQSGSVNGALILYPNSPSVGGFRILNDTVSSFSTTVTNSSVAQATFLTFPDPGSTTANILLSKSSGIQHVTVGSLEIDAGILISGIATGGTAGQFTGYSPTASLGSLSLIAADNAGNFANILTNASTAAPRTWTLPDASGTLALTSGLPSLPLSPTDGGTGLSNPTAHGIMVAEGSSNMIPIVLSSGQILIGSTGVDPVAAAINSGTGILVGNGAGSITVSLAAIASHDILSNITSGSAAPIANTLTATIDAAIGSTQGNILYRNSTVWTVLAPGTSGQFLQTQGAAANPQWVTSATVTPAALTKTDDTNVTLTLGGSPSVSLLAATSLTLGWTGQLGLTRGGTAASLTASNGGIVYSTASALAILLGTATANLPLLSGSSAAPTWGSFAISLGGALTTAGALTTSGAFGATFTFTNTTSVTFPTLGTLATTSQIPTGAALTKTDDTNVTLTLGGSPTTALVNAASLALGWAGQLGLTRGGTAASLTASNGGIFYSTASAGAILAGTATARQMLQSGASGAPAWSTSTYPATNAINTLLYASSANVMAALATANSSVLITDSGGIPSWSTTLPAFTTSSITFNPTTGGLVGTTTNDNAAAGKVGEFTSSIIASSSAVSLSNGVAADVTSLSLTAGDWDVWGNVTFTAGAGTTVVVLYDWLSSTSATQPDSSLSASFGYASATAVTQPIGFCAPSRRFSLSGTTTVYLSVAAAFLVSTLTACGGIYARRVR